MTYDELIDTLKRIVNEMKETYGINDYVMALNSAIRIIEFDSESCDTCKFEDKELYEYPCTVCCIRYPRKYIPKENE